MTANGSFFSPEIDVTQYLGDEEVHDRSSLRKVYLSIDTECFSHIHDFETPSTVAPDSLGSAMSGSMGRIGSFEESPANACVDVSNCSERQISWGLSLDSPTTFDISCPDPELIPDALELQCSNLESISGNVSFIFFDFDGTLTSTPGEDAWRICKQSDLQRRAPLLAPHLRTFRNAGISLGIISKSTGATIHRALQGSGLAELFDGPVVTKATGFEGKAGFIKDLVRKGGLSHIGVEDVHRVLLIDDDLFELEHACEAGIQTYPVSKRGGLQAEDFKTIFVSLGL